MSRRARRSSISSGAYLLLFLLLGAAQVNAATHYVAVTGADTNDGTTPAKAWRTVTYAATKAAAGDTVYIKAGLYHGELVVVGNSGTKGAPIIFQGYTNTPGDTPDPPYVPGDALTDYSTVIPVLENLDETIRTAGNGTGIGSWARDYIEIRNLGVTNFNYGIFPQMGHDIVVENVFVTNTGGQGIWSRDCSNVTIRNCVVADVSMCNILVERTRHSTVENCQSYAVAYDPDPTDYHIVVMDSQNITVQDCLAKNLHWQQTGSHPGHGIGIKDAAGVHDYPNPHSSNNKIIHCTAYDMGEYFFLAHEAFNNEFINCTASGQFRDQAYWSEGINIRDGAHDNTFRGCRVVGARTSLAFQDTSEGPRNADNTVKVQICSKNTLVNCVFADSDEGIEMWNADDNLLQNCVFDGAGEAVLVEFVYARKNTGNTCRNTVVSNVKGGYQSDGWSSGSVMPFTYSDFWQNGFSKPTGTGNLAQNPLFVDAVNRDYHLKSKHGRWDTATSTWVKDAVTSPCIDAGDRADPFYGEPNPNGGRINMGAYGGTQEASMGSTSSLDLDLNEDQEVDVLDLAFLASVFGTSNAMADLDGSGLADDADITLLVSAF